MDHVSRGTNVPPTCLCVFRSKTNSTFVDSEPPDLSEERPEDGRWGRKGGIGLPVKICIGLRVRLEQGGKQRVKELDRRLKKENERNSGVKGTTGIGITTEEWSKE